MKLVSSNASYGKIPLSVQPSEPNDLMKSLSVPGPLNAFASMNLRTMSNEGPPLFAPAPLGPFCLYVLLTSTCLNDVADPMKDLTLKPFSLLSE